MPDTLTRIEDLKSQIATLEQNAIQELMDKRNTLSRELAAVNADLAKLTGKPVEGKKTVAGKSPSLQELKEILSAAPQKTIGIRSDGYDLRNIKVLANANPQLLSLGGKGAWPTVTLLK
jgi:chromosome segregation ATPase